MGRVYCIYVHIMDVPIGYVPWMHPNEIHIRSSSLAYLLEQEEEHGYPSRACQNDLFGLLT
jgi:hypothetical protein